MTASVREFFESDADIFESVPVSFEPEEFRWYFSDYFLYLCYHDS